MVARVLVLGPPAQLRGRPAAGGGRESVDRAHAARDRDVKELADAYGYPKRKLGYKELAELATGGWAAVGKPQFGKFKYVHTNPDFSTAGLSAVAASYYAAVGKKEGLTVSDVVRGRPQVQKLERSIVHYGDTTLFIADEMRRGGLGYASAGAMEETTMIDFNRRAGDGAAARRGVSGGGDVLLRQPFDHAAGRLGDAGAGERGEGVRRVPGQGGHSRGRGPPGLPARRSRRPPAGPRDARPTASTRSSRPACCALPEPKVLAKIKATWRRIASRPT